MYEGIPVEAGGKSAGVPVATLAAGSTTTTVLLEGIVVSTSRLERQQLLPLYYTFLGAFRAVNKNNMLVLKNNRADIWN